MATPEEIVTVDSVCDFFASNGGQATNKELVTHFRNPAFTQAQKEQARERLKSIVNQVAAIQTTETGDKVLALKPEFKKDPSPPPPDLSSSLLDDVLSAFDAPRQNEDASPAVASREVTVQYDSHTVQDDVKDSRGAISQQRMPPSRPSKQPNTSSPRVPLPTYDELFVKTPRSSPSPAPSDPSPVPPPRKSSRSGSIKSTASGGTKETNPAIQPQKLPLREVNSVTQGDATLASPEDMSLGSDSVTTGSAADMGDTTPGTPGSLTSDAEAADENSIVSVKERAQKLNKIQSESDMQKQTTPPRKKTGDRSAGGLDDDGHSTTSGSIELSKEQRIWLVVAATSDYHQMAKMLHSNPTLAKMKDFTSGYTGLHWAAKAGELEVVKLIAGCGVDVNTKSNGGYTALHLAAMQGHQEVMHILEDVYGANPNVRDHSGKRPKQYLKQTVQILFNGASSGLLTAAAQGFAQRQTASSDDEDSVFHRGLHTASFSARVKRTRDHFLSSRDHFLSHFLSHGNDEGADESSEDGGGDRWHRHADVFHPSPSSSWTSAATTTENPSPDHGRRRSSVMKSFHSTFRTSVGANDSIASSSAASPSKAKRLSSAEKLQDSGSLLGQLEDRTGSAVATDNEEDKQVSFV